MSNRSISPDSANGNNNNIQAMPVSAHLHAAVDQCIDALCFAGTHSLDVDLRAQPKTSQGTTERLIQEQHRRVEENFGPQIGSAEVLASTLDELFRIDSASITESPTEPGQLTSPVVDIMTDTTAKIFKKEMKQRIHEWEGAFRQQFGKDPTPQDKNRLKHIYELYKVVKNRVLKGGPGEAPPQPTAQPQQSSQQQPRTSTNGLTTSTPSRPTSSGQQQAPSPSMTPSTNLVGNNNNNTNQQQSSSSMMGTNVQLTPMSQQTPMNNNNNKPSSSSNPGSRAPTPTTANQQSSSSLQQDSAVGTTIPANPTSKAQYDQLVAQKKILKRELHAFEGEFTNKHGRAPAREDRLPLIDKYQRYGELKIAIQNWQKEHGGGGGDE